MRKTRFFLPTHVDLDSFTEVYEMGANYLDNTKGSAIIDLSDLQSANSAVVALLVGWWRHAKSCDQIPVYTGVQEDLAKLIEVLGVEEILCITETENLR